MDDTNAKGMGVIGVLNHFHLHLHGGTGSAVVNYLYTIIPTTSVAAGCHNHKKKGGTAAHIIIFLHLAFYGK